MPTHTESKIEALAKQRQATTGAGYAQAYAEVLQENPSLYDSYDADAAGRVQALQRDQQDSRHATETAAYTPGVATQRSAEAQIEAAATRVQAAEPHLSYAAAYAKALEQNPRLYDEAHVAGQRLQAFAEAHPGLQVPEPALQPRQFAAGRNDAMWKPVSTPAGQAAGRRGQALEGRVDKLVTSILNANPGLPYVCAVARAFDVDRGLWKECRAFRV